MFRPDLVRHCVCVWYLPSLTFASTPCLVQVVEFESRHAAALQLYPAVTHTADMVAATPGTFEYNCDVVDHLAGGMRARLVVTPS